MHQAATAFAGFHDSDSGILRPDGNNRGRRGDECCGSGSVSSLLAGLRFGNAAGDHCGNINPCVMITGIVVATVSMIVIALAHHMGFIEKAYAVCGDIAKCPMCCSMWGTLVVLLLSGHDFMEAVALSFIVAYLSNWFGLLLAWLSIKYDVIWQRANRSPRSRGRSKTPRPGITRTIYKPIPRFNSGCHNC